jgi:hypothetical protein
MKPFGFSGSATGTGATGCVIALLKSNTSPPDAGF